MSVRGFLTKYFGDAESTSISVETKAETKTRVVPRLESTSDGSKQFHIFTDGACSDNGRRGARGGFGVHYYSLKGQGLDLSEPLMNNEQQTNNRGELRAIQAALDMIEQKYPEWSKEFTSFCIWSDSEYSLNSLTKWAAGWKRNGWKKGDGGIIQNIDIIKPVYEKLSQMPYVTFKHVRAHQVGKETEFPYDGNVEADRLARASVRNLFPASR